MGRLTSHPADTLPPSSEGSTGLRHQWGPAFRSTTQEPPDSRDPRLRPLMRRRRQPSGRFGGSGAGPSCAAAPAAALAPASGGAAWPPPHGCDTQQQAVGVSWCLCDAEHTGEECDGQRPGAHPGGDEACREEVGGQCCC